MAYIFDTNVLYDLATVEYRDAADRLCERGRAGHLAVRFTPIAVIEIASRLHRDPAMFGQLKLAARLMIDCGAKCLPDPEQRMREILHDGDVARQLYSHWDDIMETLSRAPTQEEFSRGFNDIATATRRAVDIEHVHRYREEYERQFTVDLTVLATHFNHRYDRQAARGRPTRLTPEQQNALNQFLASPEWSEAFHAVFAARAEAPLPNDAGRLGVIDEKTAPFKAGYEWLLREVFCDGRHVNFDDKNDYNDMHLLLYVNRFADDVLVSSDEGVILEIGERFGKAIRLDGFVVMLT
jgi:hypothetical protein